MARLHGRRGALYMGIAAAGVAEPVAFISETSMNFTTDKKEVTAFGDNNKVYVVGLPDASGTFAGFYDDATAQMYTASQDGVARKFYMYPSTTNTAQYFYGTAFFDFDVKWGVDASVDISGTLTPASGVLKVG